jgi:serine/threonine-protein kinase
MTRDNAKAAITAAGFTPKYDSVWDAFPDTLTKVTASDPAAAAMEPKGTTVTLTITGSL